MENVIRRVRQKIAEDGDGEEAYPPATLSAVQQAEAQLGFVLPSLLRELYVQVGNGGFGPGYGLIGVAGGAEGEEGSLVETYHAFRPGWSDPDDPFWAWPDRLLPICEWGCAICVCLDCSKTEAPVVVFDPHEHRSGRGGEMTPWDDAFSVRAPSLSAWLEAWLDGVDL